MTSKRPKYEANLVVVGAGSGGLVSAYIAAAVKAKVILVEKHLMGGDCLNTGCVPSKALIKSAKVAYQSRNSAKYGLDIPEVRVDFKKVMDRVKGVVEAIEPHDSIERYSSLGVECVTGEAEIMSPHEVRVGDRVITTKNIIVATGARPAVPPIPGLQDVDYLTSDTLWGLQERPQKLLVVGGGPIGCELAQAFSRLGSEVTLIDMANKLLPRGDEDVSQALEAQFKEENITLKLGVKLDRFSRQDQRQVAHVEYENGNQETVEFDKVLIAIGRQANVEGFGLENLGVTLNDNKTVKVDAFMRTNYSNIFACGDVAGPYQFTHTASHQAWYASVNALFGRFKKFKVDYRVIPWVIFTDPEVGHVGASESELEQSNIAFDVTKYGVDDLDRAIAESEAKGFVKVLTKKGSDKILGATIVGANAGEIIVEFVSAMKFNKGLNSILSTIHSYPTWAEANKYSAGVWKKANTPKTLLKWIEKYHRFVRG